MADPLNRIRGRFDRAIEWRVRAAVERSITEPGAGVLQATDTAADEPDARETAVRELRDEVAKVSVQLTDQHRALAELVEQLDRRLTALERDQRAS